MKDLRTVLCKARKAVNRLDMRVNSRQTKSRWDRRVEISKTEKR